MVALLRHRRRLPHARRPRSPCGRKGTIAVGFRDGCQPPGWDVPPRARKVRAGAEARRLLYVACTRARDLLVIPSPPKDARVASFWKDLIAQLPPTRPMPTCVSSTPAIPLSWRGRSAGASCATLSERGAAMRRVRTGSARRAELLESAGHRSVRARLGDARRAAPSAGGGGDRVGGRGGATSAPSCTGSWNGCLYEASRSACARMAEALAPSFGLDASAAAERAATAAERAPRPARDAAGARGHAGLA